MALIRCPECGKEVSDKAAMCVNCGFPIREFVEKGPDSESLSDHNLEEKQSLIMEEETVQKDWYDENVRYDIWLMNARLEFDSSLSYEDQYNIKNAEKQLLKTLLDYQDFEIASTMKNNRVSIAKDLDGGQVCKIAEAFLYSQIPFTVFDHDTHSTVELNRIEECSSIPEELLRSYGKKPARQQTGQSVISGFQKAQNSPAQQAETSEYAKSSSSTEKNIPKCPTCGSTDIQKIGVVNRAVSTTVWGLASKKISKSFKCNSCGYTW